MTVFTGLRRTCCSLTVGDNCLGRLIGYGAPGVREVTAVTVSCYVIASTSSIVIHMLGQLRLGICHVDMTQVTVFHQTTRTAGIGISKVVMTTCRLRVTPAHTMEQLGEAIEAVVMTFSTRRRRTSNK